jgi:RHS repeat-associated protein
MNVKNKPFLLALFLAGSMLHAHNVLPNAAGTLNLSPLGPMIANILIQHFPGESCTVDLTLAAPASSNPLVTISFPNGNKQQLDITAAVTVNRAPVGTSESVLLSGSWIADPFSSPPAGTCDGSGAIAITVIVTAVSPPHSAPAATNASTPGVGEPIATATGELYGDAARPDLDLGGPLDVSFRRYYGSYLNVDGVTSALGPNWMHNYDMRMNVAGNTAAVTLFRGKTVYFAQIGSWQLASTEKQPYQLVSVSSGYQFYSPVSNLIYSFNSSGALTSIADRNGNTVTVTQASNGLGPSQVSDGLGRTLTFTYSTLGLIKVQDQSGRSVSFGYDGVSLLSSTDANGNTTNFSYVPFPGAGVLTTAKATETRPAGNLPFQQAYDASGRIASQVDAYGNTLNLNYANSNGGATVSESSGTAFTQTTDANMNLTSQSDPSGGVSKYSYDANNRPTLTISRIGNQSSAAWDAASGMPASYTDELGNTTTFTYAASTAGGFTFHDLASVHFADGSTVSLTRDSRGNVTSMTDQGGNVWQSTYTANGLPATMTNPSGGVYTFSYNSNGTQASIQLPSTDTTKFSWDALSRPIGITNPDSTSKSLQYDAVSNLLKATDERNNSNTASFDANNNLNAETDAMAATTNAVYDLDDRLTTTTDPLGKAVKSVWDAQSRLTSLTNAAGNSIVMTYDSLNRVTATADASGNGFKYGLDGEGRPASITDALSRVVNYTRDAHGNITLMSTPKKESFSYSYDGLNRLASATDPLGRSVQYTRDPRGILTSTLLPGGVGAAFGLNALGLATSVTDPMGNVWNSSFDNMARVTAATDPLSRKTSLTYDSRQRISAITFPIGTAQYSYDPTGNLTALKYSDGTSLSYTWDADDRLTAASGIALSYDADSRIAASNGLQVTRDPVGRIASVTYASGKTVNYTYNNRGFLSQVSDWVGGNTTFTYDAAGELTTMALANGTAQTNTWDSDGRLASLTVAKGGTTLAAVTLTRDTLGRVTSAVRSSANIPAEARGVLPLAYDAGAQVTGETFDGLGRDTSDAIRSYAWDLASRLTSYTGSDGAASFTYDAKGLRLSRTSAGTTQNYVWNYAMRLPGVSTVQSGGADQTYYVWLPDGTLLNSISAADNSRRFYHFDESGSAMLLTDGTGTVTDTYAISIYGDTVTQTGSTANPFTWQGKFGVMREGSTSMYYMRARYYDSGPARFLSRDPLSSGDPREINPYQFVRANPMEHADGTGMGGESGPPNAAPAFNDFLASITDAPVSENAAAIPLMGCKQGYHNSNPVCFQTSPAQTSSASQTVILTAIGLNSVPPSTTNQLGFDTGLVLTVSDQFLVVGDPSGFRSLNFYGGEWPSSGPVTVAPTAGVNSTSSSAIVTNPLSSSVTSPLFPFLTNQLGFDTGISIANTSTDPFGTTTQSGTCSLNFYGAGATNPPPLAHSIAAFSLRQSLGLNPANPPAALEGCAMVGVSAWVTSPPY